MPLVNVRMVPGRTPEQKRALVEAITDAMVEHTNSTREFVWVMIDEVSVENWATGGKLVADQGELATRHLKPREEWESA